MRRANLGRTNLQTNETNLGDMFRGRRGPSLRAWSASTCLAVCLLSPTAASSQVRRIEITAREAVADGQAFGDAGAYEIIKGLIHGEVDPKDQRNRVIQDLDLAPRNARGHVEYVATFALMKPVAAERASGVLMYSVVNRGNGAPTAGPEGHISLVSGWQGDVAPTANNQTIRVPVARGPGGAAITGPVLARFFDLPAGTTTASIRIGSMGSAFYPPDTLDTSRATLTFHRSETPRGETGGRGTVPRPTGRSPTAARCRSRGRPIRPGSA